MKDRHVTVSHKVPLHKFLTEHLIMLFCFVNVSAICLSPSWAWLVLCNHVTHIAHLILACSYKAILYNNVTVLVLYSVHCFIETE
jgi:hypothetical protein